MLLSQWWVSASHKCQGCCGDDSWERVRFLHGPGESEFFVSRRFTRSRWLNRMLLSIPFVTSPIIFMSFVNLSGFFSSWRSVPLNPSRIHSRSLHLNNFVHLCLHKARIRSGLSLRRYSQESLLETSPKTSNWTTSTGRNLVRDITKELEMIHLIKTRRFSPDFPVVMPAKPGEKFEIHDRTLHAFCFMTSVQSNDSYSAQSFPRWLMRIVRTSCSDEETTKRNFTTLNIRTHFSTCFLCLRFNDVWDFPFCHANEIFESWTSP